MKLQKKKWLVLLSLIVLSCSACGNERNQTEVQEEDATYLNEGTYRIQADLTHNGTTEVVVTNVYGILKDSKEPAVVTVENHENKIIWQKEIFLSVADDTDTSNNKLGEDAYFLCNVDGKSCLLYYTPYIKEDNAVYSYKVFWFGQDGSEIIIEEDSISFDTVWKENMNFPIDEMVTFANQVNQYMDKAYILVSTIDGELSYSTLDTLEVYKENYQLITGNDNIGTEDELKEILKEYKSKLEGNNL